ncbi:prepilin-type N-terminal cleavage/methylation domain-containing protein [Aquibacillus halophilus]|uniref:ComG operon protein 3 n=1 Tax=Aquibacillus halophilus TaxID=930132 RepID=A0A6A8DBX6_9BACI|nr:competence type IV pilus major pilin ComGC [Aquibacillus halophilus]MRH43138.1 prepilin-type N-terminal cleavage/methylation domain-containing protein [Aquibacillus halophilus]
MKNQKGFTLIEMLIVLTIISTLLILLVPNLAEKNTQVQNNGCKALAQMTESQVQAYEIENGQKPANVDTLINSNYLKTNICSNGTKKIELSTDGVITIVDNIIE